jgi:hypothetical protein
MSHEHPALEVVYDVYRVLAAVKTLAPAGQDDAAGCFGALAGLLADTLAKAYGALLEASSTCTCGALHKSAPE